MAKAFSLLSWNVEHFKNQGSRVDRIVKKLVEQKPDVFALYEVEGANVFSELTQRMPKYHFHITEGRQVQEVLVGARSTLSTFFTQKLEFKSGVSELRPGALLTVTVAGQPYPILFLHTKSGSDPRGLGLRDDMLEHACNLRKALDAHPAAGGRANYLFLGDLNTMGMRYKFVKGRNISGAEEVQKLTAVAKRAKMRVLTKDEPATWSNGSGSRTPPSNLDHVIAAEHLAFRQFAGADVTVRGWPKEKTPAKQDVWIRDFSDHGLLFLEVERA
jgi:endonuclease/exonuclease/phosphatase family metal-dependent hydrolase